MRCGKCKQQWHATPPLITLPVSEIPVAVVDEVADVTPAPETVAPDITETIIIPTTMDTEHAEDADSGDTGEDGNTFKIIKRKLI